MRVGLRGQVRKVWAPRGVAVSQTVPIGWKHLYVAVALDPMTGRLWWAWQQNMKGGEMARIGGPERRNPTSTAGSGTGPPPARPATGWRSPRRSPTGPECGTGPGNRCCARTGQSPAPGRSAAAGGRSRRATGARRCRRRSCTVGVAPTAAPVRPGGSRCTISQVPRICVVHGGPGWRRQ